MAAHRPALRLELDPPVVRRQPQRVYNGGNRVLDALESWRTLERRGVRAGGWIADHCNSRGSLLLSAKSSHPAPGSVSVTGGLMSRKCWSAICLVPSALCLLTPAYAVDKKLTEDDRVEILRGLMAEYATVKTILPRSRKPLPFESTGTWDKQAWAEAGQQFGPAARVGDQVQITHVNIESDKILLEINHGMKGKGGGG